jgi:hypothetical protein
MIFARSVKGYTSGATIVEQKSAMTAEIIRDWTDATVDGVLAVGMGERNWKKWGR